MEMKQSITASQRQKQLFTTEKLIVYSNQPGIEQNIIVSSRKKFINIQNTDGKNV